MNGDKNAQCARSSSHLENLVYAAIDTLVQQSPELFDIRDETGGTGTGQYRVLDKERYLNGLVSLLQASGLCAERDPDDYNYEQLLVKQDGTFSETFDVLLGTGYIHRIGMYRLTCVPASFPVDRGDAPPVGSGCGPPYPPPISRVNVKLHFPGGDYDLLDSTPIVGPDAAYCAAVGFTDGRSFCAVRPDGSPERVACEGWRMGPAKDTGRPGPTWTRDGNYCTGPASGCENHPDNQYDVRAYASGRYEACGQNGVCGELIVRR